MIKMTPNRRRDNIAIAVVFVLGAVLYFSGGGNPGKTSAAEPIKTVIDTSMPALLAEYNANSIAFDASHKDKIMRMHGTVVSVIGESYAPALIVSEPGSKPYPADFDDKNDLSKLRPGDAVTFTCDDFEGVGMMNDCNLTASN